MLWKCVWYLKFHLKIGVKYESNSKQTIKDKDYKRDSLFFYELCKITSNCQSQIEGFLSSFFLFFFMSTNHFVQNSFVRKSWSSFLFFCFWEIYFFCLFLTGYNVMDATINILKQIASVITANTPLFAELGSNFQKSS